MAHKGQGESSPVHPAGGNAKTLWERLMVLKAQIPRALFIGRSLTVEERQAVMEMEREKRDIERWLGDR